MIKIVYCDIDGTLSMTPPFSKKLRISRENLDAIGMLSQFNCRFVLATGKGVAKTQDVAGMIDEYLGKVAVSHIVCLNGCVVVDRIRKEVLSNKYFAPHLVQRVTDYLTDHKLHFLLWQRPSRCLIKKTWLSRFIKLWLGMGGGCLFFKRLWDFEKFQKILVFGWGLKAHYEFLTKEFSRTASIQWIGRWCFEIIDKNIDKYYAIQTLNKELGIGLSESCAIGNSENDRLMLKECGFSIGVDFAGKEFGDNKKIDLFLNNRSDNAVALGIQHLEKNEFDIR